MATAASPTRTRLDYSNAHYADGPRLAAVLRPRVPHTTEWDNVHRQLKAMTAEHRCVRLETADKLCIRLGIHPALLPDSVWTTWEATKARKTAHKGRG